MGIMKKISLTLSRNSLLTIYKTFIRPILDYTDIIYEANLTESFKVKLEIVQYNASLVITGAFKGTLHDRIYREYGLEYLAESFRKTFFFRQIINGLLPVYLQSYISYCGEEVYQTKSANQNNFRQFSTRTKIFKPSFFLYCIKEWNNLSKQLLQIESTVQFKTKILIFIRLKKTSVFKIYNINGIKLLSRVRLHFSNFNEHK